MKIRLVADTPDIGDFGWVWHGKKDEVYTGRMTNSGLFITVTVNGAKHKVKLWKHEYDEVTDDTKSS